VPAGKEESYAMPFYRRHERRPTRGRSRGADHDRPLLLLAKQVLLLLAVGLTIWVAHGIRSWADHTTEAPAREDSTGSPEATGPEAAPSDHHAKHSPASESSKRPDSGAKERQVEGQESLRHDFPHARGVEEGPATAQRGEVPSATVGCRPFNGPPELEKIDRDRQSLSRDWSTL
jgi:hypothetical protein